MNILKLIRKIGKILRGGVTHRQIALGAILGVILGLLPGFSLAALFIIVLIIVLNTHIGIGLLGFVIGKTLCLLFAPLTFRLGYVIIHHLGLEGGFRALIGTPVVSLLNLQVYSLAGAIPLMIVFSWLFARLMIKSVDTVRFSIVGVAERSPKMQRLAENKAVRFFMWLVLGKKHEEMLAEAEHKQPWLRKSGLTLLIVLAAIVIVLDVIIMTVFLSFTIERGIGYVNGAEVNLADAELSLLKGRLHLQGVQITDPEEPEYNRFYIGETTVDFSIRDLLRKRLVVDDLILSDVRSSVERESPGEVYAKPDDVPKEEEEDEVEEEEEEKDLSERLEQGEKWRKYGSRIEEFLRKRRERKETDREQRRQLFDSAANRGYLAMSAEELLAENPRFLIRNLRVDGLRIPRLESEYNIVGTNVTRQPELLTEAMSFNIIQRETEKTVLGIDLNLYDPDLNHRFKVDLQGVNIGEGSDLGDKMPIPVKTGTVGLFAEGDFSSRHVNIPFRVNFRDLEADPESGQTIAGLSPEMTKRLLANLTEFSLKGDLSGSLSTPKFDLDRGHLMAQLSGTVLKAGREEFSRRAEEKFKESDGSLDKLLKQKDGDDDVSTRLQRSWPDIFGGSEEKDDEDKQEEGGSVDEEKSPDDELREKADDALKNLFSR